MSAFNQARAERVTVGDRLLLLMAILFMVDMFNFKLFGFGVTLGRVLLPITALVCLAEQLRRPSFKPDAVFAIGLLLISSIFLSLLSSSELNLELTKRLMPSYLVGVFVFVLAYAVLSAKRYMLRQFKWVVAGWTVLVIALAGYNLFYFYVLEQPPFPELLEVHQILFTPSKRIFLPTASPPHLSLISGMLCLWWLILHLGYKRFSFLAISIALFTICVLTFSRSGFLALTIGAMTILFLGAQSKTIIISRRFVVIGGLILIVAATFPFFVNLFASEMESNVITRLIDFDVSQMQDEKHFLYRTQALQLFYEGTPLEKLFGIGVGNFERIDEGSTYSFSIYLTLLAEQGLFGFALICSLMVGLALRLYRSFLRPSPLAAPNLRVWNLLCLSLSLLLLVGNMFYEFKSFVPMWLVLAWLCAAAKEFSQSAVAQRVSSAAYSGVPQGRYT